MHAEFLVHERGKSHIDKSFSLNQLCVDHRNLRMNESGPLSFVVARNYTSDLAEYKSISNTQTADDQSIKRAASATAACLFLVYSQSIYGGMDHDRDRNRGEPLTRADLPRAHPYYLRP